MPLVALSGELQTDTPRQPVLVFNDGDRSMGLMVDEIVDVIEDRLNIELSGARPGLLGSAVIGGQATDVIDTGYWLTQAWQDWFRGAAEPTERNTARRILVVEDSNFFRQLVTPIIGAAGYHVIAASSASEALRLREAGEMFDAIVSDIAMPDMDGLDFARAVRAVVATADDRAVGAHRPCRHRRRTRGGLQRLRRETSARGADRQSPAVPGGTDRSVNRKP
jgi:two-component system chemotaxis sensor kinase CheA